MYDLLPLRPLSPHPRIEHDHTPTTELVMLDLHALRHQLVVRHKISAEPHGIARTGEPLHQSLSVAYTWRRDGAEDR